MSSTAAQIPREQPGDEPDDVLFNSKYGVRLIELNRPKKLNSLNGSMARKIIPRLKVWVFHWEKEKETRMKSRSPFLPLGMGKIATGKCDHDCWGRQQGF